MASKAGSNLPAPIIVKKITVVAAGHHGGAWKVAYADFVTAMMAFFLLLWLLGATTEDQRKGLADYFTPTLVKTKERAAGSNGLLGGSSLTDVDDYPHAAGQTGTRTLTIPKDMVGGPREGAEMVKRIRQRIEQKAAQDAGLQRLLKQVRMVDTTEGVRIDLVDNADFSMFTLGTTVLTVEARRLLQAIASSVLSEGNRIIVRGHTDSLQYRNPERINNWSLSTGRAEATRQMLKSFGITDKRFRRIEGVADTELLIPDDPTDPRNRRISIVLAAG
ncbi:MAG: flagellar motor protein [Sphingomonadales bacterium]|nr:MAG: flagellar motor protein [Sphingomonadales bacterium]